ncbi:hypothetical protein [Bosea sp. R86505]|uniref:hypothetical protein n=1 Tax=Bosea sp. R86505 TaxID=3101710 RepID=UPI00367171C7
MIGFSDNREFRYMLEELNGRAPMPPGFAVHGERAGAILMILQVVVLAGSWLIASPVVAQTALPFATTAEASRLWGGCIGLKLTLQTRSRNGNPSDWKPLILTVADRVAAKTKIDSIEIDLRRGDESSRPRDESSLAHLLSDVTPKCSQPMATFLRVASRLLSERELKIRDLYASMAASGIPERAGSVCLNSLRAVAKWISALAMPQPGLAAAR